MGLIFIRHFLSIFSVSASEISTWPLMILNMEEKYLSIITSDELEKISDQNVGDQNGKRPTEKTVAEGKKMLERAHLLYSKSSFLMHFYRRSPELLSFFLFWLPWIPKNKAVRKKISHFELLVLFIFSLTKITV